MGKVLCSLPSQELQCPWFPEKLGMLVLDQAYLKCRYQDAHGPGVIGCLKAPLQFAVVYHTFLLFCFTCRALISSVIDHATEYKIN